MGTSQKEATVRCWINLKVSLVEDLNKEKRDHTKVIDVYVLNNFFYFYYFYDLYTLKKIKSNILGKNILLLESNYYNE